MRGCNHKVQRDCRDERDLSLVPRCKKEHRWAIAIPASMAIAVVFRRPLRGSISVVTRQSEKRKGMGFGFIFRFTSSVFCGRV